MDVRFIDYGKSYRAMKPEIDLAINSCLEAGDLYYRDALIGFERDFAKYCGRKYGIGTGSCTGALFLSLKALGIGPGDEVITVAHTYIATIDVIKACGANPVLVDVEYDSMNMDMGKASEAITERTKAIIPVHLNGRMCDMGRLMSYNIPVIEDAAQAAGASYNGRAAGSWGIIGCFSFFPAKIIGACGEGGMAITDSEVIAPELILSRDHGEWPWYVKGFPQSNGIGIIHGWGYNSILDNIQAAILNVKLRHLNVNINRRREIAGRYQDWLCGLEGEIILPFGARDWLCGSTVYYDVFQNYVIRVPGKRDGLQDYLASKGIETMVHWRIPNHKQVALGLGHFNLPVTEKLSEEVLSLPIYPELTDDQVHYVCETVKVFFK